jgi:glycogen debranching enzyme
VSRRHLHIGYALHTDAPSVEHELALEWLRSEFEQVTVAKLNRDELPLDLDVLWMHAPDADEWDRHVFSPEVHASLRDFIADGGHLLCTNRASRLPHELGIEAVAPEADTVSISDDGYGRGLGFQAYGHHPLFESFLGGGYVWNALDDHEAERIGYFGDSWPEQGHVIGVDKAYITLHQDSKLIVEHRHGDGIVLSVGAYIHMSPPNQNALQLRIFLRSAFDYLIEAPELDPARTWCRDVCRPVMLGVSSPPLRVSGSRSAAPNARDLPSLTRSEATDAFFDVAGRRCVAMGTERGGIDEIWCHPFRVLHELEVGVLQDGDVTWLQDIPSRIEVLPHAFVRRHELGSGSLEEVVFTSRTEPVAAIRFRANHDLQLIVRHATDFRWMWPYRENTLGSLHYGYDESRGALHVRDRSASFYAMFGADRVAEQYLVGPFSDIDLEKNELVGASANTNVIRHAAVYSLDPASDRTLHFAVAGSSLGYKDVAHVFGRLLDNPDTVIDESAAHFEKLLSTATMITSPDATFNEGYRWAIIGTDRFWADTPGVGTGLLAGYGTTKNGWNGGHDVNGRPGYGWYFARDAAWSCFAVNGYGDFESVREELRMFERYQDASGKVFFEIPLSGIVHFDSADSTPIYLILAAHYLRASSDVDTVRSIWPSLMRAVEFLYSTDTSGDGFIENRNVGHGWVEGGALFGTQTEIYLAGLWIRALEDAAYLAKTLGDPALARRFAADAEAAQDRLGTEFWDEEVRFLSFAKLDDGSFNSERTIFPAIPLMYGLLEAGHAQPVLDAFAGNEFSTDWGTHIISTKSDLFDPRGYHLGTVWPLFTGWTALAEYAGRRPISAFTHVMNNLLVYRHWALGLAEEVLNGERYLPAGVCAHQCWSETNILHPVLEGMLGLKPEAPLGRISIAPQLPLDWDRLQVESIRVGETRFDMTFTRENGVTRFDFERTAGPSVEISLAPSFPLGTEYDAQGAHSSTDGVVGFDLEDRVTVSFATSGGVGVIPHVPQPEPGDRTSRTRIIGESLAGDVYRLIVEGSPGGTATFRIRHFYPDVQGVTGADISTSTASGVLELNATFPSSGEGWVRHEIQLSFASITGAI